MNLETKQSMVSVKHKNVESKSRTWLGNNGNRRPQLYMLGWKQRSRWNFHTFSSVLNNAYSQTCRYPMIHIFGKFAVSASTKCSLSFLWSPLTVLEVGKYMKAIVLSLPPILFFTVTEWFLDFTHLQENGFSIFFSWCWGRCVNTTDKRQSYHCIVDKMICFFQVNAFFFCKYRSNSSFLQWHHFMQVSSFPVP